MMRVEDVYRTQSGEWKVEISFGNIVVSFQLIDNEPVEVSRRHISSQVYDPHNMWIYGPAYIKMKRQAAAILRERVRSEMADKLQVQLF